MEISGCLFKDNSIYLNIGSIVNIQKVSFLSIEPWFPKYGKRGEYRTRFINNFSEKKEVLFI